MRKILIVSMLALVFFACEQTKKSDDSSVQKELDESILEDFKEKDQENTIYEDPAPKYDASLPTSQYFRIEKIYTSQFLDDGRLELEIDLKNIYQYKFSKFYLSATTFIKLKNKKDYCKSYSQSGDDIVEYRFFDWQPGQIKRLKIYTPCFVCMGGCYALSGFNRTPEEIYIELSTSAISIEDEPEGVFARFDLMDLWKKKQKELIEKGTL